MKSSIFKVMVIMLALTTLCFGGLVAHYEFNDNYDDSVGINHGTAYGQTNIVTDVQRGKVANFDGNGDYIDCGNDTSLQSSDFSAAFWFKSRSWTQVHSSYNGIISKRDDFFTSLDWEIYYDGNHNEIRAMAANHSALFQNDDINPSLNTWHHLAFTKYGTEAKLYIDGLLKSIDIMDELITTNAVLRIGTIGLDRLYQGFDGYIDDVRIYDNALSQQEVTELVPEPASIFVLGSGLIWLRRKRRY